MKTWKKIEETKRRAGEVVRLKVKNDQKNAQKMKQMQDQNMKQMEARNKILRQKHQREEEKKKIKDAMMLQKQEEAKQAKMIGN